MAKKKIKQTVDILTLNYQLAELPSSQHRAGLAGLVLVIQWLERQPEFKQQVEEGAICKLTRLDENGATLELNQLGLEVLFNEIYAASTEEQARPRPFKNKKKEVIPPLREEEQEITDAKGKTKIKKIYIYPIVVPRGSFLADSSYDHSIEDTNGYWIKLWRDMVWTILRGVPATRKPFEGRAQGIYTKDTDNTWKQLVQPAEFAVDLPSTYFLGAQANNADNIPFKDRAKFQFLLHFWVFAAQIYIPAVINNEGKRDFVGYALAVPDIAKLKRFCQRLLRILRNRSPDLSGYRPRDCIVDLAIESALDMVKRLRDRLTQTTGEHSTSSAVFGIDVIHTEKQGNNIRLLSITRLNPEAAMIDEYTHIRQNFWNSLFRRQCLLNLVNHQPWYNGFDSLLCTLPYKQSIENDYFRHDIRKKLESLIDEETQMSEPETSKAIEPMIFQLVKTYVNRKLKSKYEIDWKSEWTLPKEATKEQREARDKLTEYEDYTKKKAKIAKSAFLDVRSRTEQMDFINYFVSSLCSVPQHMKSDDYVTLTQELYQDTDKIRTLTLLALSANS